MENGPVSVGRPAPGRAARRHQRFHHDARVVVVSRGTKLEGCLLNVSRGGARLVLTSESEDLRADRLFHDGLVTIRVDGWEPRMARVAWRKSYGPDFVVGLEFVAA